MATCCGPWHTHAFACGTCDWRGIGADLEQGERFEAVVEYD